MEAELAIRELDFEATFDEEHNAFALTGNADGSVADQLSPTGPKVPAALITSAGFSSASARP